MNAKTERVLIAMDFSASAREAFIYGLKLAAKFQAQIWVLHISEPIRSFDFLNKLYVDKNEPIERIEPGVRKLLNNLLTEAGWPVTEFEKIQLVVKQGNTVREILEAARIYTIDLIVLGTGQEIKHNSEAKTTAEKIFLEASCSVLCVRGTRAERRFTI